MIQTTQDIDYVSYRLDLGGEPSGLTAYLQLHMDTNQTTQQFGFDATLYSGVYVDIRVRQYANTGSEYSIIKEWTRLETAGAQQFSISVNKNAVKAGGKTLLEYRFTTPGGNNFQSGAWISITNPWTTRTSLVPENRVVTICDDGEDYRFGFNNMEKDNEVKGRGNSLDFGARMYDSRLGRWLSLDPLAAKYPTLNPYNFAANSPIRIVDVGGERLYILFYTTGHSGQNGKTDDAMFKAAAYTRQYDIQNGLSFDRKVDKVVVIGISDVGEIVAKTHEVIAKLSNTYGKTAEVGVWSHAGYDGPASPLPSSVDPRTGNQMGIIGWGSINFNWDQNAVAGFYGCNTGSSKNNSPSFTTTLSGLSNFAGVDVLGQPNFSYPSIFPDYKDNDGKNSPEDFEVWKTSYQNITKPSSMDNIPSLGQWIANGRKFDKTYMVASPKHSKGNVAQPMIKSKDGKETGSTYQGYSKY